MHGRTLDSNQTVGVASHFLVLRRHTIDFLNKGSQPNQFIDHKLSPCVVTKLDQLADRLVLLTRQTFGKLVSTLLLGINLQDLNFTRVNMRPEEVPLDQEILGTTGDTRQAKVLRRADGSAMRCAVSSSARQRGNRVRML